MEVAGTKKSATGMQKFYSKFIHKIEDFPPKFHKTAASKTSEKTKANKLTSPTPTTVDNKLTQSHKTIINIGAAFDDDPDDNLLRLVNEKNSSLEAEIFEELEKVAHDEAKLNEVLKNFDKILIDYKHETEKAQQVKKITQVNPQKPLLKSKTCSIIESRCILKKNCQNPSQSSFDLGYNYIQTTKSLWNLQDLEKFVKSGAKANITAPPSKPQVKKAEITRSKSQLPKAKSVWDLGSSSHPLCARTVSGSKIPIKTSPSRSQSFINSETASPPVLSLKKSTQYKSTIVGLNKTPSDYSTKSLGRKASISTTAINKVGVPRKLSLKPGSSELNLVDSRRALKPTTTLRSTLSTTKAKSTINLSQPMKLAPVKPAPTPTKRRDFINPTISKDDSNVNKRTLPAKSRMTTSTTSLNKKQDYALVIVNKKSSSPTSSPPIKPRTLNTTKPLRNNLTKYASESKLTPKLESSKTIAPATNSVESKKPAKLAISVTDKTRKFPPIIPLPILTLANNPNDSHDKEYQSDCSEDSGHISNGSDETAHGKSSANTSPAINSGNCKTGKISEALLEKFEKKSSNAKIKTTTIAAVVPPAKTLTTASNKNNNKINSTIVALSSSAGGNTQKPKVLFRSGVLSQLEGKRDELLSDRIIQLQAYCRGYLARRRVGQRRVQELAVRCIQRNVKAFLAVRDWPWWRLLVRVTPLLNVHRTEEQLKIAQDELLALKSKFEKIENERNLLKTDNNRLESKVSVQICYKLLISTLCIVTTCDFLMHFLHLSDLINFHFMKFKCWEYFHFLYAARS